EPPVRLVIAVKVVLVFNVPAFAPVLVHALAPSVATIVSTPPPPAIVPLKVSTPAASVKVSAPALPTSASIEVAAMPSRLTAFSPVMLQALARLGERRVGEECRSRWSPYH